MPTTSSTSLTPYGTSPLNVTAGMARVPDEREQALVADILREFSQYQVWRNTTAMQCEEIAELILPTSRNTFFYGNFNWPGMKKTQQQIDSTAALALHRFCAIADSLVTPRADQWHSLQGDDYVMQDRDSRIWFENTNKLLFKQRYAPHAGFSGQNYSNWQSLGAFGNATMYIDRFDSRWTGGGNGLRYKAVPFGETFFGENHQGKVDRIIRWFRRTAYQAVQQWGMEWLPPTLMAPLEQKSPWPYNFLHCVRPREDYDPERMDQRGLPYESHYVSLEGRCLMAPSKGYKVFPYAVSRYDQTPMEIYGRGPAHIVLPTMKTLNAQKATFLKQGHRAADPVLLLADDGLLGMDLRPGAINKGGVNSQGQPLVHTLPTGDIKISEAMMAEERGLIDDVFLVSLYKVLSEHPDMTATQVIELVNEKGMLVAPTLGRQFSEYVDGMVERELDILGQMRMLDPMPPRLREAMGEFTVKDTSPLAKAARMGQAAGFNRWVENLQNIAVQTNDPSWLDPVNNDVAAPELADIYSVPVRWTATADEIAAKRQNRAKAAQQQAQVQALPAQAAMLKAQATVAKNTGGGGLPGAGGV